MKNLVVTFKIGRGGRFNNGGHKSFYGVHGINKVSYLEEHCSAQEDGTYTDHNGEELDITINEDGTGSINVDNEYESYYAMKVEDFTGVELKAIVKADSYETNEILEGIIENYEIFKEFDMIAEVVNEADDVKKLKEYSSKLDWFNIEEITEEEYDELHDDIAHVGDKFYKR